MTRNGLFPIWSLAAAAFLSAAWVADAGDRLTGTERLVGSAKTISVTDFLPDGYVTDGSVCYQRALQAALDCAAKRRCVVVFPPMVYRLTDPAGLRVHSGTTLVLRGAVFLLDDTIRKDGQAFFGQDVTDVTFLGGEVVGQRDQWPDDVNVAGIRIRGRSARIRIRDLFLHDLSSNGIGLFGANENKMIEDVWIENVVIRNCCNKYIDYLQPHPGPVRGSVREDQGGIAFYFVRNFVVRGCSLEGSRSDGTHFYRCRDGRFVDNRVIGSKMGGYFVETCQYVLAANNIIRGNGSRGVTIERGSRFCNLVNNVIEESGRDGLWAPESIGLVVTGNVFRHNGRKDHGDLDGEIMINKSRHDPSNTPRCENYRIADNIFLTTGSQDAVIRVLPKAVDIVIENNTFRGACRKIVVDWESPDVQSVVLRQNDGSQVQQKTKAAHKTK
ncbi:MAG: hypothetical protein GXP27_01225 [Planctomycetes bacterium]|nr:hypothetical protein [Planctomycetota bacterium]